MIFYIARFNILVFILASSLGFAQQACEQPVAMKRYSACFPKKWFVEKYEETDALGACNLEDGKCTGTGGGLPLSHAAIVVISPITEPQKKNMTANEIAIVERNKTPSGTIDQLDLGDSKQCFRYASLWTWFPIWNAAYKSTGLCFEFGFSIKTISL